MRFVQNRAIAFTVTLHDPSEYLSNADVTFNWDFGDESGALISRELTVTHTYVSSGSFKPQVVIQAVIPDKACDPPSNTPNSTPGSPADQATTVVSTKPAHLNSNMVPSDTEEDNAEGEASTASIIQPLQEAATMAKTPSLMNKLPAANEMTGSK
ncbi:hypothetical protein XENOCAPTIV_017327 [Xenoophorus captivus]|uniref:PKD domain-containing protein n=1 Tax=Xenoophorus captivus TaxID=1517983 RepID=A0ABV0QTP9_9TELE